MNDRPEKLTTTTPTGDIYCRRCRYPLRGLDSRRCPECGEAFDPDNPLTYYTTLRTSRTAIAALVLALVGVLTAIVGVGVLFCIAGLVLGRIALNQIDRAEGGIPGRGMARAAAIISAFGVAVVMAVVVLLYLQLRTTERRSMNEDRVREAVRALSGWGNGAPKVGVPPYTYPDNSVVNRFNALCNSTNGAPLPSKNLVNPFGTDTVYGGGTPVALHSTNISYALLDADNPEWTYQGNAAVPLICDKRVGNGSFWNSSKWKGHVGWGDCHVTWENRQTVSTVMGGVTYPQDDLWKQSSSNDALMIDP